jgi:hypothetical protein
MLRTGFEPLGSDHSGFEPRGFEIFEVASLELVPLILLQVASLYVSSP